MHLWRLASSAALLAAVVATGPVHADQLDDAAAAAAFGKRDQVLDASISPDGSKVALIVPAPGQATVIEVIDIATGNGKPIQYADGNPLKLTSCNWASNDRLICSEYGVANLDGRRDLAYRRLVSMKADGSGIVALGSQNRRQDYAQQSDGSVIDWSDGETGQVLVQRVYMATKGTIGYMGDFRQGLGVDRIDAATGKTDHVESIDPFATRYLSDGQGHVRIKQTDESLRQNVFSKGVATFYYRLKGSDEWKPFSSYSATGDQGMYPIAIDGDSDIAYVLKRLNGRDALYRVALDGSMKTELAYANPTVDISGVIREGRQGKVVGASYATDRSYAEYFDPRYAALSTSLAKALPATPSITIIDSSADETKHLVYASSDSDPGRYFVFDSGAKHLIPLAEERPELAAGQAGRTQPITYSAADGTNIPAYLTLPPDGSTKNLPAIVLPHGGPASRDQWGFDWLVQFFANRGFAVIQPEYRGSSGYGEQWLADNAFHGWKTAIEDVNDAGRWLIEQGIADPQKLAIVGWSYGGYAALQSNVLDPDLFKAVVAIAPVTDLGLLRAQQSGFISQKLAQAEIGDDRDVLASGSPARHASAFKAPVLMFQGTKDINVDAREAALMDRELRNAGKSSTLIVYSGLDHQLDDSAARTDLLGKAETFLRASLHL